MVKHIKFEKRKELKKELSEELMFVSWHSNRWRDWCISEEKKKEIDPMFIEKCVWVLKHLYEFLGVIFLNKMS